jgi:U3 small nucleolar RNA-associated protein 11
MLSDRSAKQGRHGTREATSLSNDTVKLLKTQDAGYLRLVGDRVRKDMERVQKDADLQIAMKEIFARNPIRREDDKEERSGNNKKKGRKLVFADSREEQRALGRLSDDDDDEEEEDKADGIQDDNYFGTQQQNQQLQNQTQQQPPSKKELEARRQRRQEIQAVKRLKRRAAEVRRNRLEALKKQHSEITAAEQELDLQRGKMTNSVGGVNKHGIKWKIRERKR